MYRYCLLVILVSISAALAQKHYEGAQLLRISNANNSTANILVQNFNAIVWKNSPNFLDISFEENVLQDAKNYLNNVGYQYNVVISNLQAFMDGNDDGSSLSRQKRQTTTSTMNWTSYQSYDTIMSWLSSMASQYSSIASIFSIGQSIEGRNLTVIKISNGVPTNNIIWIDGTFHAREWISPASVTYIINNLLTNWTSLPPRMKNKTWYILPVSNPDGYEYSRTTNRLWRKNRRINAGSSCVGVDLNRNWNIGWNCAQQTSDPCSDTYKGTAPFSEPETNSIRTFLTNNKALLKGYLTYHSYSQDILWPYGYTNSIAAPNAADMATVGKTAAANIKNVTGVAYNAVRDTALGIICGASDDWSVSVLKVPYAYTVELRDTGNYGFLLPASQIIITGKEALEVAKAVANAIP